MPTDCILRSKADELKQAFRDGKISLEKIYQATSKERVKILTEYVGESAKMTVANFEKAFLVPNQKIALRNAVFKMLGHSPLYKGLSLDQSKKMAEGLNVRDLRKMNLEQRIKEFSKYVSGEMAEKLNKHYEELTVTGNLAIWEKRALGTETIKQDKKLKGSLARLEALDDLGALSPKELEIFMETLVEDKLGVNLTLEESQKLSKLVNAQRDGYDKMMNETDGNLTAENKAVVVDYFMKVKETQEYSDSLVPSTKSSLANTVFDIMRAFILAAPRILKNSFLYQAIPATERAIVKRLVSGNMNSGDMKSSVIEKMQAKLSGIFPNSEMKKFIKEQTAMALEIYHKTGYDISRMENLSDGQIFFGEKVGKAVSKGFKDSKGFQEKLASVLGKIAKMANLAPKWLAGGTDTLFANIGRADTATMLSKEIARMESMKGQLPEGVTEKQRATQLLKESYSFNPKDSKAILIRNAGILDAHRMNNTQPDAMADKVVWLRKWLKVGKVDFGKAIIPFAKIAATTISEGLKTATGVGVARALFKINRASKSDNIETRSQQMYEGVNDLIRYIGFTGAVMMFAAMLDDDDYIAPYSNLSYKEYKIARARGANAGSVRIGGKWIPLRYLPIINIPLAAIMEKRKAQKEGNAAIGGYVFGLVGGLRETPGIKEFEDIFTKMERITTSRDLKKTVDTLGFGGKDMFDWAKVRVLPSVISYDLYNALHPSETKYDFLGRDIQAIGFTGFKNDKTNDLILEFNRLERGGFGAVISHPRTEESAKQVAIYQRQYALQVESLVRNWKYQALTDEQKKKTIDKIRRDTILTPLKQLEKIKQGR